MPMPPTETNGPRWRSATLPLRWGTLAALLHGEARPQAPVVLCLHGWLDNAASFVPLVPRLGDGLWVAIDLAGHGHSDHRPPGTYYHDFDYLSDVLEVLDGLGFESVDLLAHSFGGALATLLAATFPKRVRRLVLLESIGPLSRPAEEAPERLRRSLLETRKFRDRPVSRYATLAEAVEARRRASPMSEESARLLVERNADVAPEGVRWRSDRRLLLPWPTSFTEPQVLAFLAAIECPTMVLRAEPGFPVDRSLLETRMQALRAGTLVRVAGEHHVHMDAPDKVAPHVAAFLRSS